MTRVVMNLVLNARDAMPRGGSIGIRTANMELGADSWHRLPPGRYIMLEVSDNGAGMDPETLRQIFQPFFTTKNRGGTGLDLSTVHRIVEQAGGGIWARSEPGRGTTFTICLPRGAGRRDRRSPISGAGTETILLAEDEESVRRLLRHLLDASAYQVLEAADGRELAQKALASKPGLKVIYMSGYTDDVLSNTDAPGPGMSFLRKPLKLDILSALIREVLDTPAVQ
jgi:hypothetical protein